MVFFLSKHVEKHINLWRFQVFCLSLQPKDNLEKSFSQELAEKKEKRFSRVQKEKKVQDMKQSRFIVAALSMSCITTLSSCFKEEPLNAECDIEQAYIHVDNKILLNLLFTNPSDTLVNVQSDQTNIEFTMRPFAALTKQAPIFRLTPGATISPESGSLQDFSKGPVTYTVTSEDKQWSRTYQVSIKKGQTTMPNEIEFEFEDAYLSKGYYNWQENWNGDLLDIWATGNPGFKISNSSAKPEEYPTTMIEEGYQGKGVNALLFTDLIPIYKQLGFVYAESNPELEQNDKVQSQWQYFKTEQHKRRRCYRKDI